MTRRYVVGGVDVTDAVRAYVDVAPPFTAAQRDQLRLLWCGTLPAKRPRRVARARFVPLDQPPEAA